jgi:zinc protease
MKAFLSSLAIVLGFAAPSFAFEPELSAADPNFAKGVLALLTEPEEKVEKPVHFTALFGDEAATAKAPETVAEKTWPHSGSDLKVDPAVTWGKLDNGVRYAILPTKAAPTKASLRLYMNVGSMMEDTDQRGMAHFLEHMAFNGTRNFPDGKAIEYFQRLGMKFGAHTNAFTTRDETVYQLELPRANEELTGDGLKLLRDYLDGMALDKNSIEKERGVVLGEKLARNSVGMREAETDLQFLVPDTLMPLRMPIGTAETVRKMPRERFLDFYQTWYTPGRAVVVATGDFDVKMVENLIKKNFASAKSARGEHADPDFGKVIATGKPLARLDTDPDSEEVTISLAVVAPEVKHDDSAARQKHELVQALGNLMLNLRFKALVASGSAPVTGASAGHQDMSHIAQVSLVKADARPEKWSEAMGLLEQEVRRALQYGFTDSEFGDAKTRFGTIIQTMAAQADSRQPSDLADTIVESITDNEVFAHPSDSVALANQQMAEVTKEECLDLLRKNWGSGEPRLHIYGNLKLEGNASDQILAAFTASAQKAVEAPKEETTANWAYTDFGPAGDVVAHNDQADLGIVEATFANNVRVNIKRTTFEKNSVDVIVRFGGGVLEVPADKPGLKLMANAMFISGGLEKHDLTQINRILGDKNVGVRFYVNEDAFQLGGSCLPSTLETQLQVSAAYLTAAAFRNEAHQRLMQAIDSVYGENERTLEGALGTDGQIYSFLRSNDPRFTYQNLEDFKKLTPADLKAWLAKPLASGYMEVTIVGDVDPDVALPLVAKTLGALPKRDAEKPKFAGERVIKYPQTAKTADIHYKSNSDRAASVVAWPVAAGRDIPKKRRLGVLASVLNDRLRIKVRKELGATYTPSVAPFASETFESYGYIAAVLTLEPTQVAAVGKLVAEIGDDIAKNPITDDEFARAVQPLVAAVDQDMQENGFWLSAMCDCQEHADALDVARKRKADILAINKAEIEALAKEYLTSDKATIISVTGSEKAADGQK